MCVPRVMEVLSDVASGKEEVDMERMNNLVRRQMLTTLENVSSKNLTQPSLLLQTVPF